MRPSGTPDCFCIINGPEDGAEYPIHRVPFTMGSDFKCAVNPRLDKTVHDEQARVTVVSDGYRVRSIRGLPVYVNGKRTGGILSRIVRNGDIVQLGHTLITLDCAPDGLVSRSQGIDYENDFVWAIGHGMRGALQGVKGFFSLLRRLLRSIIAFWKSTGLLGILFLGAYIFYLPFRYFVNNTFMNLYYNIADFIWRLFH